MGIALLIIGAIAGMVYIASRIQQLSWKVENFEKQTAKQSDLELLSHRLQELENELLSLKTAIGLTEPERPQTSLAPAQTLSAPESYLEKPLIISEPQPEVAEAPLELSPSVLQLEPEAAPHGPEPPTPEAERIRPSPHPEPQPTISVAEPSKPSRTREEWEALIGGQWLNRIGALAIIIGMGFFLKYAFDRNWITEWMRVLMGGFIGAGLLIWGRRFHSKGLEVFAQGLVGAGISVLYLSVYASFNFYRLVPQVVAFALMSAVTFVTFAQAFKYDSPAVALLGWLGGFLTPFLLSTGKANEVGLFTYIALLDLGLLVVVLKRDAWTLLEPLTFGATCLTYSLWYYKFYTPADLLPTVLFLTLFWGLFYALDVFRIFRPADAAPAMRQVIAALNGACYYAGMYIVINPKHHESMGLVTLIVGSIYFFTILLARKQHPRDAFVVVRYVLTAIALLVLATTIQFSGFTTVIYWALEAFFLVWCGTRWRLAYVWKAALGLFGIATIHFLLTRGALSYDPIRLFSPLLNQRTFSFSVLTAAIGASTLFFRSSSEGNFERIKTFLHYGWCIFLFGLCTIEVNDYFRMQAVRAHPSIRPPLDFKRDMILAGIWMIYSLPLVWVGLRRNLLPLLICGLGALVPSVFLTAIRGIAFEPIQDFTLGLNLRAFVLMALIAVLMVHSAWMGRKEVSCEWKHPAVRGLQYTWSLLLLFLCTVETFDYFRWLKTQMGWNTGAALSFCRDMTLVMIWILYSLPMAWIGLRRRTSPMIHCGLGAVALSIILGVFGGVSFEPIRNFMLLLNLRAFALISVLAGIWAHTRLLKNQVPLYGWAEEITQVLEYLGCLLLFFFCTVETVDHFRWLQTVASERGIRYLHYMRDMALPAVWVLYSLPLVAYGIRRNVMAMFHCGFGAFVVAVVGGGIRGIAFVPIEKFSLLLNVRAFALLVLVFGTFFHTFWLKQRRGVIHWVDKGLVGLQIAAVLLIFDLITFEIWDFFGKGMLESARGSLLFARLSNLKHLSLSGAWLLYSIALLTLGFWRRIQRLRIAAIILSGVTILKIFIYDLSFLETLYRIFSFIGLGLILLITSYFYHRFRTIIFGEDTSDERTRVSG